MQLIRRSVHLNHTYLYEQFFFARKMLDDPADALDWLRHTLYRHDLLFDHALLLEELCVPVNLTNTHWIMVFIDLKHGTFFPINPYHPTAPTDQEQQLGYRIAVAIADEFGLRKPVMRSPDYCQSLPAQTHLTTSISGCMFVYIWLSMRLDLSQNITLVTYCQTPLKSAGFWCYHGSFEEKYFFSLLLQNKRSCQQI